MGGGDGVGSSRAEGRGRRRAGHAGEQLDLCLKDSQILHNLEGLLFELKEKQLQWEKSWTFLQVPVHKMVLLLEVATQNRPK
ncbi:hypothetical protein SLEP1_g53166 [Rubroshorea leprosula]|uniref:Uncharacterized protein n=1 Tax=Rubroshorea leprosula TaxID=152421 RepID=A0AAV5M9P4_9ROSI|nr:hypothetical protein SLEP1_g53166 [Rubroshorea leprosula]